jgi:hypothetical protein
MPDEPVPSTVLTDQDKKAYIHCEIERAFANSFKGQKWWSFGNHGCTVLIVAFSSTAALLAKFSPDLSSAVSNTTIAAVLSLAVTIISALQWKLGFERKWVANRMTRSALSQLRVDMMMGKDSEVLAEALKKIYSQHDGAITGADHPD